MKNDKIIIDSHIHYSMPKTIDDLIGALKLSKADNLNLVAQIDPKKSSETMDCLFAKYLLNNKIFVYSSLDITAYYKGDNIGKNLAKYVEEIMDVGSDGIKMIEGKPEYRKKIPIPSFDSKTFEPYFDYMEKKQIPIIWHVNDPEEFWNLKKIPTWALKAGWYYDETYVNNYKQYEEVLNVLTKHPNLKVTFAHFFFLSNDLNRLASIFDTYPNVSVDMAPGIELYENLSNNIAEAKKFFVKYQDRIIYGTDICRLDTDIDEEFNHNDAIVRGLLCQDFLTKDRVYLKGNEKSLLGKDDVILNGLSLDEKITNKIFSTNFLKSHLYPKSIKKEKMIEEIAKEKERVLYLKSLGLSSGDITRFEEMNTKIKEKIKR